MRIPSLAARAAAALVLLASATAGHAQPVVPPHPSIDPGLIQERVEPDRRPPRTVDLPEVRQPDPAAVPESIRSVSVTLRDVRIDGATAIPVSRLRSLAEPYLNRVVTGAEIFELARALTEAYRKEGYLLSQVIVPAQSLADGILTLRVFEGFVAEVHIEGSPAAASTLQRIGEKIKASRPLNSADLERYLLIANDLPGISLRSVLSPSKTQGAADLTLIATERHIDGFASFDNYGSKFLGPAQLSAGVGGSQLLGVNDQWRVFAVTTGGNNEMVFGQIAYSQVLNAEGLRAGGAVSQTRTQPGDVLEPLDIRGHAGAATVFIGYPILRARNESVLVQAIYDHRDVESDVLGVRVIEDKIRAVRGGLTWIVLDRLSGQNSLYVEFSQGVGGTAGDDPLKSRPGADGNFTKANFDYERFQRLGSRFGLTLGAGGQWTNEPLLTSEQYALGGRRFGRAYEPAELVGDRALAFRSEAVYFGREAAARADLYAFYDGGKVWNVVPTGIAAQSLASAGVGTRMSIGRYIGASLEVAWPLTKPIASYGANGNDPRLLGSLTVRF